MFEVRMSVLEVSPFKKELGTSLKKITSMVEIMHKMTSDV
jgi:hypothetical protein